MQWRRRWPARATVRPTKAGKRRSRRSRWLTSSRSWPVRRCRHVSKAKKDPRRRARESALQILYQWEVGRCDVDEAAGTFFNQQWPDVEPPSDELRAFATILAHETVQRLAAIDPLIAETSERWRPERMALIDRLILRMAICELMGGAGSAPPPVVINEAMELARTFSSEESVKFINGMLDAIRKKLESQKSEVRSQKTEDDVI